MNIGLFLVVAVALCALVVVTRWAFKQTKNVGTTFLRGFAPMFSIALFAILLYEVDKKPPIPHVDDVMFSLLIALTVYAILRQLFRKFWKYKNALKKKFQNTLRAYKT